MAKDDKSTTNLDTVLAEIETMTDGFNGVKSFDAKEFDAYCSEQLEKAKGEEPEPAKKRLIALNEAIATAKQFYAENLPAKVTVYIDPAQQESTEKHAESPSQLKQGEGPMFADTNIVKNIAKRMVSLAKSLNDSKSDIRVAVDKADRTTVAKAGEAAAMLTKIATAFGIDMSNSEDACEISWKVGDAVRAIQQAAKLEQAMTALASMGSAAPAAPAEPAKAADETPATPPEAPAPEAPPAPPADEAPKTETEKANVSKAAGSPWSIDMNAKIAKSDDVKLPGWE